MSTAIIAAVSEVAVTPLPRRGRLWVILALGLTLVALGYAVVEISTREAGRDVVRVEGIASAQELFGGVPQEGDRLGSNDAPVSIQVFNDLQCGNCRADFLDTIPGLVEDYARPGAAKLLMRHYSVAENPLELGFFGAEAAAQQGYGWQYTYLFFLNQAEAERFGIDNEFMRAHPDAPIAYPEIHHATAPLRAAARAAGDAQAINLWAGEAHELAREQPAASRCDSARVG